MALEEILTRLTAALEANTAAMKGTTGAKPAATTTAAKTTAAAVPSFDAVKVLASKVMDKHGKPFAKKMISDVGGAKELATVDKGKYAALAKAFEAALAEDPEPDEADGEDGL